MPIQSPPPKEFVQKNIEVWDSRKGKYVDGKKRDVLVSRAIIEFVWTNIAASASDEAPDRDIEINVEFVTRIAIQIDTTHSSNVSTDVDINVEASLEGAVYDTEPYAERNIGDGKLKTFLIEPGPRKIRLRADNNDGSNAAYVKVRVLIQE